MKSNVPKIFMQTWKNDQIPERWTASPESVKRIMDNWDYRLQTDQMNRKFVQDHFPDYLSLYDSFPFPIQRADCIRYMWLYVHGGIYMDLDIIIKRPFDDLLQGNNDVYLVHSGNVGSYYTNALMASPPKSKFWLEVLEEMRDSTNNPSPLWLGRHLQVMNTTGPVMMNRVTQRTRYIIGTLPSKLLVPCSVCDLPCQPKDEVYAYAIPGSSWVTFDTVIYNFFLCHWRSFIWVVAIFIGLIVIGFIIWWLYRKVYRN